MCIAGSVEVDAKNKVVFLRFKVHGGGRRRGIWGGRREKKRETKQSHKLKFRNALCFV